MSVDSAGISRVLIKYSGKYVKIYFNMKITFHCVWALGRLAWFSKLFVYFLGLPSSLFPSVRHFLSFFRCSSDSVESPLHYTTGSPFGPSQLLV